MTTEKVSNPIAAAQAETEAMVAQSRAAARRRKWWLYAKLSSMRALAEESKIDVDSLRPSKVSMITRWAARLGSDAALMRIAKEDTKRDQRAVLARAFWAQTLVRGTEPTKGRRGEVKPKPRDVDVLSVPVREMVLEDGDVMIAVWSGPDDEYGKSEPTW